MKRLLAALGLAVWLHAAGPVRVLVLTGQSDTQYHDWRVTTPFLVHMLERTGRFDVRVSAEPRGITSETLANYDVIFANYNGPRWGAQAETAVEQFVASGKGFVSFHGMSYGSLMGTFLQPDGHFKQGEGWRAYPDLIGAWWKPENVGHAVRYAFTIKVAETPHPVTRGMAPEFSVNDELYHRMELRPNAKVLLTGYSDAAKKGTGKAEPLAWAIPFGKGRAFHTPLGHDTNALYQPQVLALLARATEWAGTGEVTLPPVVDLHEETAHDLRVLVLTGGHGYPTSFYDVFDLPWSHAASQKEAFRPGMKDKWDVLVLYDMANVLGEEEQNNLRDFVEAGKGVVALHHSIVDYTNWPWWYEQVIGGKYFEKPESGHTASKYKDDVPMVITPVAGKANHPIIRGLGEITTVDECYKGMWHSPKIDVLMETKTECNDQPVVYLGPLPGSRVVYIQLGHGTYTHNHPGYRTLVRNAILWAGRKTQ